MPLCSALQRCVPFQKCLRFPAFGGEVLEINTFADDVALGKILIDETLG
jgi:hypothetical protein